MDPARQTIGLGVVRETEIGVAHGSLLKGEDTVQNTSTVRKPDECLGVSLATRAPCACSGCAAAPVHPSSDVVSAMVSNCSRISGALPRRNFATSALPSNLTR